MTQSVASTLARNVRKDKCFETRLSFPPSGESEKIACVLIKLAVKQVSGCLFYPQEILFRLYFQLVSLSLLNQLTGEPKVKCSEMLFGCFIVSDFLTRRM